MRVYVYIDMRRRCNGACAAIKAMHAMVCVCIFVYIYVYTYVYMCIYTWGVEAKGRAA